MSAFQGSIYSKTLDMMMGLSVVLPDFPRKKREKYPVLYLLHGLGDNHQSWLLRTRIERYAFEHDLVVIMPEVQRSYYTDTQSGLKYFQFVANELPEICSNLFPITSDPEQTFIAGLSMGGYGALKTALTYPDRYKAVASFSGAVDVKRMFENTEWSMYGKEGYALFGEHIAPENDIRMLTVKASKDRANLPHIYLSCGLSDSLYEQNKDLRTQLDFLKIPYLYEEWGGGHTWDFWEESIKRFINFIF